jgi:hypothetical protein
VGEIDDVAADVVIQSGAVGEDERDVHQLLVRAGFVEAVESVGEPADGQGLAAAGRVVSEILLPDVTLAGKVRRDVGGDFAHQAALVVAREQGGGGTFRLVLLRLALGHADEEERERLQQLLLGQHFAVKELDRVFVGIRGRVG